MTYGDCAALGPHMLRLHSAFLAVLNHQHPDLLGCTKKDFPCSLFSLLNMISDLLKFDQKLLVK